MAAEIAHIGVVVTFGESATVGSGQQRQVTESRDIVAQLLVKINVMPTVVVLLVQEHVHMDVIKRVRIHVPEIAIVVHVQEYVVLDVVVMVVLLIVQINVLVDV